jgi:hypothetical protein
MNEVSKLKVDAVHQKKLNKAMGDYKKGKTVKLDAAMASNVVSAFDKLKATELEKNVTAAAKYTEASLLAGAILAAYKDLPKTATVTWTNKEITAMLKQLGLPEDSSLSVLVVEVFGNITSIVEHFMYMPDEALEKATGSTKAAAQLLLERRRKNRQALTNELGNYRILRTSPLTEVPFVCCTV